MLGDSSLTKRERADLTAFLDAHREQGGLDIFTLEGFLCAVACGPSAVNPSIWLAFVFGEGPPRITSRLRAPQVLSLLFRFANSIAGAVLKGSYMPSLPPVPPAGTTSRAEPWARGFVHGMSLVEDWQRLSRDRQAHMMLVPILLLAEPAAVVKDTTPDPESTEAIIGMLPDIVKMIREYWSRDEPQRASKTERASGTVHRLKIQLRDVKPPVWRRVEIKSDAKLPEVSRALLMAMGWTDAHLHAFRREGVSFSTPDPDWPMDYRDERRVTLADLAPAPRDWFTFDYDFGDGWQHRVSVEAVVPRDPKATYPR
jgi:yecA family protein